VGYEFALCTAKGPGFYNRHAGYRQSVITIPAAGEHTVRVFARVSPGRGNTSWALSTISLVVE
jgi:hypothetical protein